MNLAEHTVFRTSRFGITVEIANPSHFFRAYSEKGMPLNQIFDLYQSSGLMAFPVFEYTKMTLASESSGEGASATITRIVPDNLSI